MAVTNEQISEYLAANPSLSDAEIAAAMMQNKVTPQQVAQVTNLGQDVVQARYDAAKPSPLAQVANTGLGAQDTTSNAATGALAQAAPVYDFSTNLGQYRAIKTGDKDLIAQALAANTQGDVYDRAYLTGVLGKEFADSYFAPPAAVVNDPDVVIEPAVVNDPVVVTEPVVAPLADQVVSGATQTEGALVRGGDPDYYGDADTSVVAPKQTLNQTETLDESDIDPYMYAYEYGAENNDFSALASLLAATPDTTSLIDTYNLTEDQINEIEFGTGFDLDQSGGYGAGKVGNDWDWGEYVEKLKVGDEASINEGLRMFATLDPLKANDMKNMFDELVQQQTVTGDNWSAGNLGSKEAAAMDFALRLVENNVESIYDLGQRTVDRVVDGYNGPEIVQEVEFYNKKTGEALPDWARVSSGTNSGSKLNYRLNFADDGTPMPYTTRKQSDWVEFREGFLKPAVSLVALANPALAPYIAAGNAINAADKGDWGSAIVSALTAATGFSGNLNLSASTVETLNQAKTGAQILNAIDKGNPIAIANALAQTSTGQTLLSSDMGNGITLGDVINTAKVAASVNSGDYTAALDYASSLTGNPNLKVAASSVNLLNAIQTGDPFKIITAMGQLNKTVKTNTRESDQGGITNRVVDDLSIDAFTAAKNAGATDLEAMEAANAVTGTSASDLSTTADTAGNGVVINKIPDSESGGVIVNQIRDAESGNVVITNYDSAADNEFGDLQGAINSVDNEFGNLQGAIETNAINDAVLTDQLNVIQNTPNFNAAYAAARELLGPGQTFPWFNPKTGKVESFSTATAAERPDLNITAADLAIEALNRTNLATDTDASRTVGAQTDTIARIYGSAGDQSAAETARLNTLNEGLAANATQSQVEAAKAAINSVLGEGFASDLVTQGLSNLHQIVGQTLAFTGGAASGLGLAGPNNTLTQAGNAINEAGEGLQIEAINKANSNVINAVNNAEGFGAKLYEGAKAILENPLSANMAVIEIGQEFLPIGVAARIYGLAGKYAAIGVDVGLNAIESGGSAYNDSYEKDIKNGLSPEEADRNATKAFFIASAVTTVTGGITDIALVNKITKIIDDSAAKVATKPVSSGAVSAAKEAPVEMAEVFATGVLTALARGEAPDLNKILTQTVVEGYVGGKTAGSIDATTSAVDVMSGDVSNAANIAATSTGAATDLGTVGATVPGAGVVQGTDLGSIGSVTPGSDAVVGGASTLGDAGAATISVADAEQVMADLGLNVSGNAAVSLATNIQIAADSAGAAGSVAGSAADISNNVTTQLGSGADAAVVINDTITGAVNSGADVGNVINSTVTSSLDAGANASVVIDSAITSGITGGADASVVIGNTVTSAVNSGANVAATVESSVSSAITAGADASTAVGSSVTSVVNSGGNVAVAVDSSVASAITAGADAAVAVDSAVAAVVNSGGNVTIAVDSAVTTAINSGGNAAVVIDSAVASVVNSGGNVAVAVDSAVTAAVTAGTDASTAVNSAVTSVVNSGGNVAVAVDSSVAASITAGTDAAVAVDSAVAAVVNSGGNVTIAVDSAVTAAVNAGSNVTTAVESAVTAAVTAGANVTTAVDSAVTAAVNSGSNVTVAVESAVNAAVTAGANVDASVAAAVSSAVNSGANVDTVVDAATTAATATGNNVTVASDANVVTISNATTNTTTTVDTTTGVTTSVDSTNNVTTVVDGNTSTVVDANTNITSQTTVDANNNTQTTVTVDSNNNSSTETVVDNNTNITTSVTVDANSTTQTTIDTNSDTQTTVLTNIDDNTQTTVKVNTDTGDVIEVIETEVPTDWKPPVIDEPKVPEVPVVKTPEDPTKPAVSKLPSLKGSAEQRGGGGFGLPLGIDVDPASLRSKVTGGAIDPLARVKQAQAELERDVMMNQLDPRFAAVIQQRTNPQQQAQQYENDIGALAKMLSGEPSAPANEGKYYSYGAEDSIDDILGGSQRTYKEGGFVEPLKASGGMVLPLLAKSGGALGKYSGREDFKGGKHVAGDGDGQSDDIPAWLADGEFVFPADVVSALGNGSTKAGTDKLYAMMHGIRDRARSKGPKDLPPPAFKSPLDYLKSSKRSK
jgi:hypothetical protein